MLTKITKQIFEVKTETTQYICEDLEQCYLCVSCGWMSLRNYIRYAYFLNCILFTSRYPKPSLLIYDVNIMNKIISQQTKIQKGSNKLRITNNKIFNKSFYTIQLPFKCPHVMQK